MSGKERKVKKAAEGDQITSYTIPESLPCSEVNFPILIRKRPKANWAKIVEEAENVKREIKHHVEMHKEPLLKSPFLKTECDYIKNEVFVYLLPALENTLNKAKYWDVFHHKQTSFFSGLDYLAQELWNNNPRYPIRKYDDLHIFNMPWVRAYLEKRPRPFYPKSWLWTEEYAATLIQKTVRQYFVQRIDEVQEMRQFWKKLKIEQKKPSLDKNPFLAREFASSTQSVKNPEE